ncbi:MAG: hypothetical protein R3A45_07580 [Bdellovibrionota bacterium]
MEHFFDIISDVFYHRGKNNENLIKRLELGIEKAFAPNIACASVIDRKGLVFEHYSNTTKNDLFDLASLTKVIFTTTLCALQVEG